VKRTSVTNGGTPVDNYYIFDGEHWVVEYDANGAIQSNAIYGNGMDEVIARGVTNQGGWFYFPDRNGNISVVTDGVNTVRESYRYDAFGTPTVTVPGGQTAINNRFLFTGREWNATYGFYEYRARAYNPTLGRFTSEDPKGFDAGDYNLYRYCNNDPMDLSDPMGMDPAGNAAFARAMELYKRERTDAKEINNADAGKALFNDARDAARDTANEVHTTFDGGHRTAEERGYAEYTADGKTLQRTGPSVGEHDAQNRPQVGIPKQPDGVSPREAPITASHSHPPGAARLPERNDIPVANGANPFHIPIAISVGWSEDRGKIVNVYIPTGGSGGQALHTSDGIDFSLGFKR
jgi:RHS repeat-associated protein